VVFRAFIEPPNKVSPPDVPDMSGGVSPVRIRRGPSPQPVPPDVVDLTQPDISELRSSDLLDALPIMLVGIGVAYMIGVASGAWIFSPVVD
jgi:hypothetical protein